MNIFALSDLHLSNAANKPMDVFGDNWTGHWEKIRASWSRIVSRGDAVLLAGDTSWGMTISEALTDLEAVEKLPGKKFLIRGNHDYWWSSYNKLKNLNLETVTFIQNNAFKTGGFIICGTRGWTVPETGEEQSDEDKKIFARELARLRLTLDCAVKSRENNDKIILMFHYPPFNSRFENSPFTDLVGEYPVDKVVYGHLHGCRPRYKAVVNKKIDYILTSCDFLNFSPLKLY